MLNIIYTALRLLGLQAGVDYTIIPLYGTFTVRHIVCIYLTLSTSCCRSNSGLFHFEWQDDGAIALRAQNGRYITAKMNGSLYATSDSPNEKELFYMTIVNRPILVLKCDYGFVGFKSTSNPRIECNKATYDVIYLEHTDGQNASYYLKGRLIILFIAGKFDTRGFSKISSVRVADYLQI